MRSNKLEMISITRYGIGVLELDAVAALWLAEYIFQTDGICVWKTIANHRRKHGKGTTFPQYGSTLFNAM